MKENVIDVLMYLFEHYMYDEAPIQPDRESLQVELLEAGFSYIEINKAFDWLDVLNNNAGPVHTARSFRLYTDQETRKLDTECRGFLLFLEQMDVLTPANREMVIDRVLALETDEIDLEQLKWIVLMVLFSQPGQEAAYCWMEELMFNQMTNQLH